MAQKKKQVSLKHGEIVRLLSLLENADSEWYVDEKLIRKLDAAAKTKADKYNENKNRPPSSAVTLAMMIGMTSILQQ